MSNNNATAFMNLAALALRSGHEDQAIRFFKDALELKPGIVEAYIGMGLAYTRTGQLVEMAKSFRKAVQINPSAVRRWAKTSIPGPPNWLSFNPEYSNITGAMAELLHKQDEADALARLAAAHISHGLDEPAITALEYSLQLTPDYEAAIILISVAYILLESKQMGAAARIGSSSVLKKIIPRLASNLFKSME